MTKKTPYIPLLIYAKRYVLFSLLSFTFIPVTVHSFIASPYIYVQEMKRMRE